MGLVGLDLCWEQPNAQRASEARGDGGRRAPPRSCGHRQRLCSRPGTGSHLCACSASVLGSFSAPSWHAEVSFLAFILTPCHGGLQAGAGGCPQACRSLGTLAASSGIPTPGALQVVIETEAASYALRFMAFQDLQQVITHVTMALKKVFPDSSPG